MGGVSEEVNLLNYILENAPAKLAAKMDVKAVEDYLGVIHEYVEQHNEPVNSDASEKWVLERFIAKDNRFNMTEARTIMDLELEYWESGEEGKEDGEEEEDEFFSFDEN